jgi:hypothetical protein
MLLGQPLRALFVLAYRNLFNSAKPMRREPVLMDHVLMCDGKIPLEVLNDWA